MAGEAAEGSRLLSAMNDALAHRGPDGEGIWSARGVGLAQRRLAIIDLAGGGQPMASADGRYQIVFNGEIYNYVELRAELTAAGYTFATSSDTEVIPAVIDHWGAEEGLRRLRGMFAFALYDSRDDALLLARDPVGIKPLFVGQAAGGLTLFASEPKAILLHRGVDRRADPVALVDFFTLGEALSPRTAFASIREVEPGTFTWLRRNGQRRARYFTWAFGEREPIGEEEAIARVEEALADSLRAHLVSDVPVAAFLSGGSDSSLLVALLAHRLGRRPHTFNVGFAQTAYDESRYARDVARHLGTDHHEVRVHDREGTPEFLQTVLRQFDQPFGDSSCLPTWIVCREMARHSKVVLSGDGGDEMFGGYPRYSMARRLAALRWTGPVPELVGAAGRLVGAADRDAGRQLRKAGRFARLRRGAMLCAIHTYFDDDELAALLDPDLLAAGGVDGPTYQRFMRFVPASVDDAAEQLMTAEITTVLNADYLRKVDVASSAHGLEVRTPYLDRAVFDLTTRLPLSLKLRPRSLKHVLRALARRHVPHHVVDRPKQGFGIPFDRWASPAMNDFLVDILVGPGARCRGWLRADTLRPLLDAYRSGAPVDVSRYQVYQRVFMLASFELWLRAWSPTAS